MSDSPPAPEKTALVAAVKRYGLLLAPKGSEFTLASGASSHFYIDFSRVLLNPTGARIVLEAVTQAVRRLAPTSFALLGGPSAGADPLVAGVLARLPDAFSHVQGFLVRKEPKGRGPGAGDLFEGFLTQGARAVILEDVTTSGGSVEKAIDVLRQRGVEVVKVLSILDRQAGAAQRLNKYDFESLMTLADLGLKV